MSEQRPSAPSLGALGRLHHLLLERWLGAILVAGLFAGVAWSFALQNTFLHDEGVFTYSFARALWNDLPAILFVHKGKPINVLLEAPAAGFGFTAYLLWHALLGGSAIVTISAAARRLGLPQPNLAGIFLATGGIYLVASANGYPNLVGAALLALFLYLHAAERHLWAALLLGALPLSRYELAAVVLPFVLLRLILDRDWRYLLGVMVVPGIYVLAGAVYWQDWLWLPHSLIDPNILPQELHTWSHGFDARQTLNYLFRAFRANSPFLLVFFLVGIDARRRRTLEPFAVAVFFYLALSLLQFAELQKFAQSLRHHLSGLPLVALGVTIGLGSSGVLARRLLSRWTGVEGERQGTARLARGARLLLVAAAFGLVTVQLVGGLPEEREQHRRNHALVAELERRGLEVRGRRVYTDLYVAAQDRCAGFEDTRFLVNGAITWELQAATLPSRRPATFAALAEEGWIFSPEALPLEAGALYLISTEARSASWRTPLEEAGARSLQFEGWVAYEL